jgi:NarL family two-component system response regulator YdfI
LTRVIVIARSAIARAGLESLLQSSGAIGVIGAVADAAEFTGEDPDVVLADSLDLLEGIPAVVLWDEVADALRSGARAVLPRQASAAQIIAAVGAVAAGLIVLQPGDLDALAANPRPAKMAEPLTPRELELLNLLAEGHSNKAIAHRLGISEHTVKFHVTSIMAKLDAGSRTEAVTLGIRQGLIMI